MPNRNSEEVRRTEQDECKHVDTLDELAKDVTKLADALHGSGDPAKIVSSVFERLSRIEAEQERQEAFNKSETERQDTEIARLRKIQDRGLNIIISAAVMAFVAFVGMIWTKIVGAGK
jgi:CRISPR/Cas system-associated protein Csm6